ncbi:MAG: diversity-generating retroelement protein Avd [Candidatus Sumerlaeia bacterium]|nr:diversity-generating retroelement protein Avd [Candidatus Sumerlaeia bacterium]
MPWEHKDKVGVSEEKSAFWPKVVNDSYDLALWYLKATPKFQKSSRFTLGDRIERTALELVETAIRATYTRDKATTLDHMNELLDRLRLLTRMATDLRQLSPKQQEFTVKAINNIGKQVGGWRRSLDKKRA